jgi:secondary thiamine-phosphate synthase enzyme
VQQRALQNLAESLETCLAPRCNRSWPAPGTGIPIPGRRGFENITATVEGLVRKSGVREGLCLVNAMHITASVYINDAEDGLLHDYDVWLEKLAPHEPTGQYHHNRTGEDNADAHLKRQIMGREVVVAITNGELDLGPWEQIFYGEFDGKRRKRVLVKIIGE